MSSYPTTIYLAQGDLMTPSGSDYVPSSNDYIDLSRKDRLGPMTLEGGLLIPSYKEPPDQKKAGAMIRIRGVRAMPIKVITLHMIIRSTGNDNGSVWKYWGLIEQKLEQAMAAGGAMGHGTGVCLLVRFATVAPFSGLGANFVAFDVLGGTLSQNDLLTNPGTAYGATLELRCLPYGRLTAQTAPGVGSYTANISAGLSSFVYLGDGIVSGPIPGHVGALCQLHILDTSTAGAINAVYIGRRAVPALGGGMAKADWAPVVGLLSSPATHVADSNTVGTFHAEQATTDTNWHTLGIIAVSGADPKYEAGIYDVLLRVREQQSVAPQYLPDFAVTATLPAGEVLMPDTYNMCVAYDDGTLRGAASAIVTVTTQYGGVWPPNMFYDGFETGDASAWFELAEPANGVGDITVSTQASLVGTFGARTRLSCIFPSDSATKYYKPALMQLIKTVALPSFTQKIQMGGWLYVNGGLREQDTMILAGLSSSYVEFNNPRETTPGSGTPTATGYMGGFMAALGVVGQQIVLLTWNTVGTAVNSYVLTSSTANAANTRFWVTIQLSAGVISGAYTASCTMIGPNATYSQVGVSGTIGGVLGSVGIDQAIIGISARSLSASADLYWDDVSVHCDVGGTSTFPTPNQGIYINGGSTAFLPTTNFDIYVQQNAGLWRMMGFPQGAGSGNAAGIQDVLGPGSSQANPPSQAVPAPSQFRCQLDVKGSTGNNPVPTNPLQTNLQGNQWHLLNMGTLTLPPISKFEGLNPANGGGAGDFGWQMTIQGQAGASTSNVLSVDCVYLLPHDEPQLYLEYPGLANATLYEWVADTRRDGRTGAIVRDAATKSNVLQTIALRGHMLLAPGNQSLVIVPLMAGGVHDVQHCRYQVQVRYQELVDFYADDPAVY